MKKFTVKNYKGNILESLKKFQESHKDARIIEAFEQDDLLRLSVEEPEPTNIVPTDFNPNTDTLPDPNPDDPTLQPPPADEGAAELTPIDKVFSFGCKVLMFGSEVHIWHLNTKSYAAHMALQELYEACDDVADRLLEAAIGMAGREIDRIDFGQIYENSFEFKFDENKEAAVNKVCAMEEEAKTLNSLGIDGGIANVLDDFCATCNSVIYKLKRLD